MTTLVPAGNYMAKAIKAEYCVTTKNGIDYLAILCEIVDDPQFTGRRIEYQGWFKDIDGTERTMQGLALAGWDPKTDPTLVEVGKSGVGTTRFGITVEVEDATFDQQTGEQIYAERNRVAWINDPGRVAMGRKMNDTERATLKGRLAGFLAQRPIAVTATPLTGAPAASAASHGNGAAPTTPAQQTASGRHMPV